MPEGMGVILRTAGASRTKIEIKRDFEYLLRLWETVRDLTLKSTAPKLVYEEGSLVKRSIRDLYSKDIDEVIVAGAEAYQEAKDFMRMLMPSHAKNVKPYADTQPLLSRYGVESQLDAMFSPVVQLRSGGYIVLNQAEALVAIDVNSGRATREHHIEDTALKTNLEAADEIARQLRLRDLAGLIVIDFIDMDEKRNNRAVERRLKECLKHDRARIQVGRISHFGLLEMSRQRIRTSVLESSTEKCPYCGGTRPCPLGVLAGAAGAARARRAADEGRHAQSHRAHPARRGALCAQPEARASAQPGRALSPSRITIIADETVTAPQAFVIDRGEQVHTVEAARRSPSRADNAPSPRRWRTKTTSKMKLVEDAEARPRTRTSKQRPRTVPEHGEGEGGAGAGGGAAAADAVARDGGEAREHIPIHEARREDPAEHASEPLPKATTKPWPETKSPTNRRAGRRRNAPSAATVRTSSAMATARTAAARPPRRPAQSPRSRSQRRRSARHERALSDAGTAAQFRARATSSLRRPRAEPELKEAVADLDAAPPSAPRADTGRAEPPHAGSQQAEPPRRRSTVREPAPIGGSEMRRRRLRRRPWHPPPPPNR